MNALHDPARMPTRLDPSKVRNEPMLDVRVGVTPERKR